MRKSRERMFFKTLLRAAMALACFLVVQSAVAQLPTATISGTVKDATGGVVPGAAITVANVETGFSRSGTTAGDGSYKFPALPVGTYEVRAELPGFQREVKSGLELGVGQDAVINFTLQIGSVEQTVAVTAEAPLIDTTSATVSGLVSENQVRDLPLNARNLIELAALFPGITFAREGGAAVSGGFATKLAIVGTRSNANLFQLDGQDINDNTGSSGSAAGILMGVETIREFNVITAGYSAEYGKHSGGVFNAITKSGTNNLHGSVFEFLRNNKLDARNFFDEQIPPYKRNQFGFSVGGPIVKDRTFFFGSYEGLRERLGLTQIYTMPDAGARQGVLPNPATGAVQTIAVNREVQPYLDSYPLPNGENFRNGTGEFIRGAILPTTEDFFAVRADHTFSEKDSLWGRYTLDDANQAVASSFNSNTINHTRAQYAAVGETRLFSPQVINMFLLAFNRSVIGQRPVPIAGFSFPRTAFTDSTESMGSIAVTGLGSWGGNSIIPSRAWLNQYQVKDDVFYTRGAHSFKFGFNAQRMQLKRRNLNYGGGAWSFTSLAAFLQGTVNQFQVQSPTSDPAVYVRQTLYGGYAQDDIRLSPKLTLNLGLRYEFVTTPFVLNERVSNLHNFLTPGQTPRDLTLGNPIWLNPSLGNFAPRVGFAWDPTGSGKTSIRGGAGIYYDQVLAGGFANSFMSAPPFFVAVYLFAADRPKFPTAYYDQLSALQQQAPQSEGVQYKLDQPTVYKYSLDVQRAITANTSVEVGFAATRGVHLMRVIMANPRVAQVVDGRLFIPSTAPFFHPAFTRTRPKMSDGTSSYYGFRMQVNQRYTRGLMFRGAYTYSKVLDDGSNWAGSNDWDNSPGQSRYLAIKDPSLASFDIRHAFTLNSTYDLPGNNLEGAAGKIAGGWQVSGILTAQTGTPFTISSGALPSWMRTGFIGDYPDLVAGAQVQYNTRNPNRYFEPSAFSLPPQGIVGNLARNFGIGPGIAKLDIVLTKNTRFRERINLQFRVELFNLLNRANFGRPAGAVFDSSTRAVSPTVGRITDTDTISRQLQLGLKVEF